MDFVDKKKQTQQVHVMRDVMAEEVAKRDRSNNAVLRCLVEADGEQLQSIVQGLVPGLDAGDVLSAERITPKKRGEATGNARAGPRLVKVKLTEKGKRVLMNGNVLLNMAHVMFLSTTI